MKTIDMHHKHLFKGTGKKNNEKGWRSVTQSDDENSIKLTITLKGISKEDLDIHIKKMFWSSGQKRRLAASPVTPNIPL